MFANANVSHRYILEILKQETVLAVLKRQVDQTGGWLIDGAAIYAEEAKAHHQIIESR